MEIFLLFVVFLFTCALFNYQNFLPSSKLIAWVCSLLPSTPVAAPPNPAEKVEEEDDDESDSGSSLVPEEDDELEGVFSTFDGDGDGFITVKELEESLRRLGIAVTEEEVAAMVERVDSNGDGLIDLGEFRELYAELGRGSGSGRQEKKGAEEEVELREAFGVFDGNKDGMITAEELAMVLRSLGLKQGAAVEDCREMIRRVDMDGDGKVNFEEFKKMMKMKGGRKKLF